MTYVRPPVADVAEKWALVEPYAMPHDDDVKEYVWSAVFHYSRVREENDALRQRLTSCVGVLGVCSEDMSLAAATLREEGFAYTAGLLEERVAQAEAEISAVAALSRKVESDEK